VRVNSSKLLEILDFGLKTNDDYPTLSPKISATSVARFDLHLFYLPEL
jgi:hypothetical protein